jgi:hypothetical protein
MAKYHPQPRINPEALTKIVTLTLQANHYHVDTGIVANLGAAAVLLSHYLPADEVASALQRKKSYVLVCVSQYRTANQVTMFDWYRRQADCKSAARAAFAAHTGKQSISQHHGTAAERPTPAPLPTAPQFTEAEHAEMDELENAIAAAAQREDDAFLAKLRAGDGEALLAVHRGRTPHFGSPWWRI